MPPSSRACPWKAGRRGPRREHSRRNWITFGQPLYNEVSMLDRRRFERMAKRGFLARHGIVRNAIREDMLYFAIPAVFVLFAGMGVSAWDLVSQPENLYLLSAQKNPRIGPLCRWIDNCYRRPNYTLAVLLFDLGHKGRSSAYYTRHLPLHATSSLSGSHHSPYWRASVHLKSVWSLDHVSPDPDIPQQDQDGGKVVERRIRRCPPEV